jgi:hypothetical protein
MEWYVVDLVVVVVGIIGCYGVRCQWRLSMVVPVVVAVVVDTNSM